MAIQPSHSSRRILLPVRQWFILFSLVAAFFLNLIPLGDAPGMPDWVALVLAFWSINIGLALMVLLSLLPVGLLQTWASVEKGTWYARSAEFMQTPGCVSSATRSSRSACFHSAGSFLD